MSRDNSPSSNRRKEYFAEYWQDLTIVSNEEVVLQQPKELNKTNEKQKKKKKKSRGNRSLQKFKSKLRKQGLNDEAIASMIASSQNNPTNREELRTTAITTSERSTHKSVYQASQTTSTTVQLQEAAAATKRKRETVSVAGITTSLSEISLMQPSIKRTHALTITTTDVEVESNSPKKKPNYLHVTDQVFKQMLSTTLKGIEGIMLTLLDTSEKLQYARTYAQLTNDLFYLKMKEDFWKYYYTRIISSEIDSSSNIFKSIRKKHNLHRLQFLKQENILKRQQIITEQLKEIENQLIEHKQLTIANPLIDLNRLSTIIPAFVRRGQHKLYLGFERKKLLLQFDINDYCLVKAFYNLKPSTDQIASAKVIWQATVDQQKNEEYLAILKQRIYTKRLPASFNLLDHSIDQGTKQMLQNPLLHVDKRVTLSSQREKIISRFKYDLVAIQMNTIEETIRTYSNVIVNEKKKLTDTVHGQLPLPKFLVNLLNAIAARQSNIIKRAQLITKHKLSFFDYAPTATQEEEKIEQVTGNNTVGATI